MLLPGTVHLYEMQAIPDIGYVEQNKTLMEKALDFEFHDPSDRSLLYSSEWIDTKCPTACEPSKAICVHVLCVL